MCPTNPVLTTARMTCETNPEPIARVHRADDGAVLWHQHRGEPWTCRAPIRAPSTIAERLAVLA